jgi:hypothetical protein
MAYIRRENDFPFRSGPYPETTSHRRRENHFPSGYGPYLRICGVEEGKTIFPLDMSEQNEEAPADETASAGAGEGLGEA